MKKTFCIICDKCNKVLEYSDGRKVKKKDFMTVYGLGKHPDEHFCDEYCWVKLYYPGRLK